MRRKVNEYISYIVTVKGLSPSSICNYRRNLYQFADYLALLDRPIADPRDLTVAAIESFYHYVYFHTKPISKSRTTPSSYTRRAKASALRSFLAWLLENDEIQANVLARARLPRLEEVLPHCLFKEDLQKIWNVCDDNMKTREGRRDAALCVMLFDHGLRITETLNLRVTDLDKRDTSSGPTFWMKLYRKGRQERFLPVTNRSVWYVHHHLASRGVVCDYIFNNFSNRRNTETRLSRRGAWDIIQKIGERAGINPPLHPHTFRHTFVTQQIEAGADPALLLKFMNWKDPTMLDKYYHVHNAALLQITRNAPSTRLDMIGAPRI